MKKLWVVALPPVRVPDDVVVKQVAEALKQAAAKQGCKNFENNN